MKLNWKVRFKNKVWLSSFLGLIVSFVYSILVTQNTVAQVISQVLTLLGLIGVIQDPTTAGIGDSARALTYDEPWDDANK